MSELSQNAGRAVQSQAAQNTALALPLPAWLEQEQKSYEQASASNFDFKLTMTPRLAKIAEAISNRIKANNGDLVFKVETEVDGESVEFKADHKTFGANILLFGKGKAPSQHYVFSNWSVKEYRNEKTNQWNPFRIAGFYDEPDLSQKPNDKSQPSILTSLSSLPAKGIRFAAFPISYPSPDNAGPQAYVFYRRDFPALNSAVVYIENSPSLPPEVSAVYRQALDLGPDFIRSEEQQVNKNKEMKKLNDNGVGILRVGEIKDYEGQKEGTRAFLRSDGSIVFEDKDKYTLWDPVAVMHAVREKRYHQYEASQASGTEPASWDAASSKNPWASARDTLKGCAYYSPPSCLKSTWVYNPSNETFKKK